MAERSEEEEGGRRSEDADSLADASLLSPSCKDAPAFRGGDYLSRVESYAQWDGCTQPTGPYCRPPASISDNFGGSD